MVISTEFLTWYFLIFATFYNALVIGFYFARKVSHRFARTSEAPAPIRDQLRPVRYVSIMIPARDEQLVIEDTVRSLAGSMELGLKNIEREILIIDDESNDGTPEILDQLTAEYSGRVLTERRQPPESRKGKAEALNFGLRILQERYSERDPKSWVIGVFDADAICEPSLFSSTIGMFETRDVDAIQCGVRISNSGAGWLPLLQDVEFLSFSGFLQNSRSLTTGSTMLGGNAQFVRADALDRVSDANGTVWNPKALTEDLDLGMKLHCIGAELAFCDENVLQQGLQSVGALLRQRTRWAWGTIQTCFWYLPRLRRFWGSPIPIYRKLDIAYFLVFWLMPIMVGITWLLALLSLITSLTVVNPFGTLFLLAVSLSYIPLLVVGMHEEYKLISPKTWLVLLLTVIYTYHWVLAMLRGVTLLASRKTPEWFKTSRIDPASYSE